MSCQARLLGVLIAGLAGVSSAQAQSASLLRRPRPKPRHVQIDVSLIRQPVPTPFKVHDLITIHVEERTLQQANARVNRRKDRGYEVEFADLIVLLSGFRLRADQAIRDERPAIDVSALNELRNTMQSNRQDRLEFDITGEVAEIKPNGTLVIEAHGTVGINNDVSTYTLSGIVDPRSVNMVTRSIDSDLVAHKRVQLDQIGPTRDALKRGWLTRFTDMFAIF